MRLLESLRPAPEVKAAPPAATFSRNLVPPGQQGRPYRESWSEDRGVREGFQRIVWIFRAVHVRASKSAGLPIVVRRGDPDDGEPVGKHPLLPLMNAYPTGDPQEGSAFVFRYRLSAICDLIPRGAFVEVLRGKLGDPVALRLLPPFYTWPIPGTGKRFLDGFRVHIPGTDPMTLAPESVVWVRSPHPTSDYSGITPLQAAGIAVDTEWAAKVYQRQFLRNNMSSGGFLLVAGDTTQDDLDEIQAQIDSRSGPQGAGKWIVVEGTEPDTQGNPTGEIGGVKAVPTTVTPQEAAFLELRKFGKEELFAAFGMSDTIGTGSSANRTYENADADYLTFWRDNMVDHCRVLDRPFDSVDADPETFVGHDFSSVAVLQRDRIEKEKHLIELRKDGTLTYDEVRSELNPPRDPYTEGGDVVFAPVTVYPVAGTRPLSASTQGKAGDPAWGEKVAWAGWTIEAKTLKAVRRSRARKLTAYEKQCARAAKAVFGRQERAVIAKLRGSKARQGTRHWKAEPGREVTEFKIISASDLFDPRDWDEQLSADVLDVAEAALEDFGQEVLDAADGKGIAGVESKETQFDRSQRVLDYILARGNRMKGVNDTTFEAIAGALAEGEAAGETIDGLAAAVQGVFEQASGYRSEMIARTEVIGAANFGAVEGMSQSGVVDSKSWLATEDERTRDAHAEADGQTVGLDEAFEVGGEELDYPGDDAGSAENVINCRCTVVGGTDEGPLF